MPHTIAITVIWVNVYNQACSMSYNIHDIVHSFINQLFGVVYENKKQANLDKHSTVLPAKSESGVNFCLQNKQGF